MDSKLMDDRLQALASELAKDLKTPEDLSNLTSKLLKLTVETALNVEMDHHLGYQKHDAEGRNGAHSRNGSSKKTLKGNHGEILITTPRDRDSSFEPSLIRKNQTRITGMDDQILTLYAKGLTTRDIAATFKSMYDVDVSAALVSQVTEAVLDEITEWQNRPLDQVYPILYLDGIVLKIRQDKKLSRKRFILRWVLT